MCHETTIKITDINNKCYQQTFIIFIVKKQNYFLRKIFNI